MEPEGGSEISAPRAADPVPPVVLAAARAARAAPSADNLQPLRFAYEETSVIVAYRAPAGPSFPAHHPATLLAAGAAIENIVQAAAAMEIGVRVDAAATPVDAYAHVLLDEGGNRLAQQVDEAPLFKRHTNRHAYRATPAIEPVLIAHARALCENRARIVPIASREEIAGFGRLTQVASEARFRTAEIHAWFAASLRFATDAPVESGLDVRTLDLPVGGRHVLRYIADWPRLERLNRFGAYRLLAAMEAKAIHKAPWMLAIVGDDAIDAGRLTERVWIDLNARGLAVQPFYVIPDQMHRLQAGSVPAPLRAPIAAMTDEVRSMLGIASGEALQMVLRVGWPTREAVRASRLPLERLLVPL